LREVISLRLATSLNLYRRVRAGGVGSPDNPFLPTDLPIGFIWSGYRRGSRLPTPPQSGK
jgi:hypothetical protein